MVFLNTIESTIEAWLYHWTVQWYWVVLLYTIERTAKNALTLDGPMVRTEWYSQIPLRILLKSDLLLNSMVLIESLKQDFIIEWSNATEWYSKIPLKIPLKSHLLLHSMFKYHWENNWNKILSLNVWFIIERNVPIPLRVPLMPYFIIEWSNGTEWYWMVLQITAENTIESYWNTIEWSNGTEWYSLVFNGIPLALFCQGHW